ncbi:MAG: glycosyltransferase family 2 protein [Chitinispirillaceae bacterium]|nr:glycosyltransferase family 2 protein [Chitinispirillaceae bacterium]
MNIELLLGPTPLTKYLFFTAVLLAGGDILATLFAVIYQRFWYEKIRRPKFSKLYVPRCSIIVPCKGVSKNFNANVEGFLKLDYGNFEVLYIVENERDPAAAAISEITNRYANARLVIAGLSKNCAQKNHNLLAGIREAHDPDVYVFADSDIRPAGQWLHELVLPLSEQRVAVTSGYRWLHAKKGTLGEQAHALSNVFIYVLFSVASFLGGVGLWGGSMAIRKKTFDELEVAELWSRTAVDDMSLSQVVKRNRYRSVIVPASMTHSDELLPTVTATFAWFTRQTMFLKAYFKAIWLIGGMILTIGGVTLFTLLPLAALGALSEHRSFLDCGGAAASVLYIGECIVVLLYPLLGPMPRFHTLLLYMPIVRITHIMSYFRTIFSNVITWAGVRYYLTFSGNVARIERPTPVL